MELLNSLIQKMKNNKETLRKKYAEIRRNLSPEYISKNQPIITKKVIDFIQENHAKSIAIYYAIKAQNEVDTKDIIQYCFDNNIDVYLPRWNKDFSMDFYLINSFNDLEKVNGFDMPKMTLNKLINEQIDIAFIPLIAVDKNLNRIGYGKGYYDRWINNHSDQIKELIGLCWREQLTNEDIDQELTDKSLNRVIIN